MDLLFENVISSLSPLETEEWIKTKVEEFQKAKFTILKQEENDFGKYQLCSDGIIRVILNYMSNQVPQDLIATYMSSSAATVGKDKKTLTDIIGSKRIVPLFIALSNAGKLLDILPENIQDFSKEQLKKEFPEYFDY